MNIRKQLRAPVRSWLCNIFFTTLLATPLAGVSISVAGTLSATVTDANGVQLEHAIVSLLGDTPRAAPEGTTAIINQRDRQFSPTVIPVQTGTAVTFPNTDDVHHHVYSFSHPNAFELKLYHGEPSKPVVFDESGIVVLGCNIHDGMVGYMMVVDTPWYDKTAADGVARIEHVSVGTYTLQVWHPDMGMQVFRENLTVGPDDSSITVSLKSITYTPKKAAALPAPSYYEY